MKKGLLVLAATFLIAGCQKKDQTVNNYNTGGAQPAFAVNGITDVSFVSQVDYVSTLSLSVQYLDSAQENVSLSLNGLPSGIVIDTTWINSGIPTFSTTLNIYDTVVVSPGSYPVTLTATTTSGKTKNYPFNIRVQPMPSGFLGKYNTCNTSCGGSTIYTDSLYVDPLVQNKVWFTNFANTGNKVYALVTVPELLTIPNQTVGGITYSSTGTTISLVNHQIAITIRTGTSGNCFLNMR